ncbi:bifunctional PIG-L family deacetylase/class I SAM-dependent methyltransferase [Sanguibacter sp. 25GB23B1]|uniref:bifunctional PIG-L family deacetylase/class I SAM-dependent methyltransferase n=1 Tax=unclassified Sanguibacter TaxID=2645534 RepID=UPI0032AF9951
MSVGDAGREVGPDARRTAGHVAFDHRDPGTSESEWATALGERDLTPLDLDGVGHLVVLAAHPDDETLGAAGLVGRVAASGVPVTVVVATDGDASHPASPTWTRDDLVRVRRAELVAALAAVAPRAAVHLLGLPDGGLREAPDQLHRALDAVLDAVLDGVLAADARAVPESGVGAALGASTRDSVVLCAPWAGDGHRDHRVAGEVARAVATGRDLDLLEYPVWMWHWAAPSDHAVPWDRMERLDLTPEEQAAKAAALAAHRSQTAPLSAEPGDEATLGQEMVRHFERQTEVFVVTRAARASDAATLPQSFFDDFYSGRSDPWGFETRWYEERKRAVTLASLPRQRFTSGLEIGCSTGVLTAELVGRCDALVAVDIAAAPLEAARDRVGDRATFLQLATPHEWPAGRFDLVVLSEVGYYYGSDDLDALLDRVVGSLTADGVVVACHWRHPVAEYPSSGDAVHAAIAARSDLARLARHDEADFLLDVLVRPPAVSVAARAGLA